MCIWRLYERIYKRRDGIQENHERFKSPYNAFRADILDVLPIVAGGGAAVIGGFAGPTGAIAAGVLAGGNCNL